MTEKGKQEERNHIARIRDARLYWAKKEVYKAVRKGLLPRVKTLKCLDCGKQAEAYDHRDYSRPLLVEPVCKGCNAKRGPGLNRDASKK